MKRFIYDGLEQTHFQCVYMPFRKKAPNEAAKTFGPFAARVALQGWSGFSQTVPHAGH
jgi:hypothetical protein